MPHAVTRDRKCCSDDRRSCVHKTGQTESSEKTEDLLEMVKKLQKEGSLEPQIEDLINRIHELQQAKEKSSEELGEAQALWEALRRDLDSLNGEKVHLEEVLSRKQGIYQPFHPHYSTRPPYKSLKFPGSQRNPPEIREALRTLQLYCQRKAEEAQRLPMEEQLEDLIGPHKDLWEFHMLKRRLAWEIRALQSSKEQLLFEGSETFLVKVIPSKLNYDNDWNSAKTFALKWSELRVYS
ncbi:hypothetical protein MJT46_013722 [Ovis ammon polii x Ovis aries]|nr:hypothetical protein MJT46_013722 [Ovis ammon polii x Ovis aries]